MFQCESGNSLRCYTLALAPYLRRKNKNHQDQEGSFNDLFLKDYFKYNLDFKYFDTHSCGKKFSKHRKGIKVI